MLNNIYLELINSTHIFDVKNSKYMEDDYGICKTKK